MSLDDVSTHDIFFVKLTKMFKNLDDEELDLLCERMELETNFIFNEEDIQKADKKYVELKNKLKDIKEREKNLELINNTLTKHFPNISYNL